MMKKLSIFLLVLSLVFLVLGTYFLQQGFDKKDNYYMSEHYSSLNENAYVGGDAYNYIINGTYFAGYCALGGTMFICAAVLTNTGIGLLVAQKKRISDTKVQIPDILPSAGTNESEI